MIEFTNFDILIIGLTCLISAFIWYHIGVSVGWEKRRKMEGRKGEKQ